MENPTRTLVLSAAVCLGLLCAGLGYARYDARESVRAPTEPAPASSHSFVSPERTLSSGVSPRPVDAVAQPLVWTSPELEPEILREQLAKSVSFSLLFSHKHASRYTQFRRLQGFVDSAAGLDTHGAHFAACRVDHEPKFEADCNASITVVLARDPKTDQGRAMHAEASVDPGAEQACRRWAACVVSGWPERRFDRIAELTKGDYLTVAAPIVSGGFYDLPAHEYGPFYEKLRAQFERSLQAEHEMPQAVYEGLAPEDRRKLDVARAKQRDIMEIRLRDAEAVLAHYGAADPH